MREFILIACLMCLPVSAPAQEEYSRTAIAMSDCHSPVGIVIDKGFMYVTSMGPTYHENLDGCIIRYNMTTGEETLLLQNQINSPKSMVITDGKIVFIDSYAGKEPGMPSVTLADMSKNTIIGAVGLDGWHPFDIVQTGGSEFIVSDSKNSRLYLLTLDGTEMKAVLWLDNVPGAKGLAVRDGYVYVVGYAGDENNPEEKTGMIHRVDLATKGLERYQAVDTPSRTLNAIAFKDDYMFVGDWGGKRQQSVSVYVYRVPKLDFVAEFKNVPPGSDFTFDGDSMYLTDMTGDRVVRLEIDFNALDRIRSVRER